jgi:hypothetical protein
VPKTAFVNDIKADLFNESIVYVALDNHKYGDFSPYLLKSTDKGRSWKSIKGNIPEKTLVWRMVQDHIKPELLFAATEFGIYFTIDGGAKWTKLTGGIPTISFRDLAIQRQENDLVGASFGRGFFILDDYSSLRNISETQLSKEATLFPARKAWWYIQRSPLGDEEKGSMGASLFTAPNPPFGAEFTYYIGADYKTQKELRIEKEKKLKEQNQNIPFPGWDALEQELNQDKPKILLTVKDIEGNVVRKLEGATSKGFHRIAWDLRYPSTRAISPNQGNSGWNPEGIMAAPGKYTVTLSKQIDGIITNLSEPIEFEVEQLRKGALQGSTPEETVAFWKEIAEMQGATSAASLSLQNAQKKVETMIKAVERAQNVPGNLETKLHNLKQEIIHIQIEFYGSQAKGKVGEIGNPTVYNRMSAAQIGTMNSTYGPTPTHIRSLEIAKKQFEPIKTKIEEIINNKIPELEKELVEAGAPWIQGQDLP